MEGDVLTIGVFRLSLDFLEGACASFVRKERRVVNGRALIYNAEGPHGIRMEIHYIKLDNGDMKVVAGEVFDGPMWVFGQLNGRLSISVVERPEGFSFDLTIPSPGKRNSAAYTASMASVENLNGIYADIFPLLQRHGANEIGMRGDTIGDTSTRRGFTNVILESHDCAAPVIGYFITRTMAIVKEFDRLVGEGAVTDERVSNFSEGIGKENDYSKESDTKRMIDGGESSTVEFKPALWYDKDQDDNNPQYTPSKNDVKIKGPIIRSVAGFLNSEGGTLLIGVSDDGDAYGIQRDVELTRRSDLDGYELELFELLRSAIGDDVVARNVKITFPEFQGLVITRVDVRKSSEPVFASDAKSTDVFFVRIGNATVTMSTPSAMNYVKNHDWGVEE